MPKYYNYDIVFQEIPDEVTLAVNITACPNRCPGCHSPHLQEDIGVVLESQEVDRLMAKYGSSISCFCFMGGDGQCEAIVQLTGYLRKCYPNVKVALYSGWEALPKGVEMSLFDYVKLGGYVAELGGLNSPTTNQKLWRIAADGVAEDISYRFWRK